MFIVDLESGAYNDGELTPATVKTSDDDGTAAAATPGPGSLYGWKENNGPINIIDTDPGGVNPGLSNAVETPYGSDIANATPASPVVITPDVAKGIQWTGALVYLNDLEGKITKINLTNQTKPANITDEVEYELFEQTTLFHLDASISNDRYSYHSMDATIGKDTNNFWLFGGTGNEPLWLFAILGIIGCIFWSIPLVAWFFISLFMKKIGSRNVKINST